MQGFGGVFFYSFCGYSDCHGSASLDDVIDYEFTRDIFLGIGMNLSSFPCGGGVVFGCPLFGRRGLSDPDKLPTFSSPQPPGQGYGEESLALINMRTRCFARGIPSGKIPSPS